MVLAGLVPALSGCATAPTAPAAVVGTPGVASAAPIAVEDAHGNVHRPLADTSDRPVVLIFITTDCPIANSYAPEINRLVDAYDGRTAFYLVQVDRDVTAAKARRHGSEYGYRCPVLLDVEHRLVHAVGATVTPEAALVLGVPGDAAAFELVYRGRIDDRYVDFGRRREAPSRRDLRDAIDAALSGAPAREARTRAIGCFIPDAS